VTPDPRLAGDACFVGRWFAGPEGCEHFPRAIGKPPRFPTPARPHRRRRALAERPDDRRPGL